MLAACTIPPPVGANEPPDAVDRIREVDLQPRFPQSSANADTGSAGNRPQLYYGSSGGQATGPAAASPGPGAGTAPGDGVNLNFEDSPVSAVAKVILGDILGVGYSIDPRVQGTISLSSGRPVPKSEVLFVLESALHTSNAVLVHDAGGYHIVPADDAVGSGRVDRAGEGRNPEPGYGISVVPLQHVSVQTITKLLESFAAKPGSIRGDPSKNLLIVVGNGTERRTAVDTILSFDEDWMRGQSVGIFPVHNTQPEPLVAELEKILDSGDDGLSQHLVKLQPVSRLNAVLVVARKPELLRAAEKWISRLDNSAVASTGVKVYKVRYGDCVKIAKLLTALFIGGGASTLESAANQIAPGGGATTLSAAAGGLSGQGQTQGLGGQTQAPYGGLG
ncbi:MAG: type II secretion system protein GspD, partial [Pseudomonadota bacterium]|nr:type II secretion system protein GspD [Pseudomonadota bacterium]